MERDQATEREGIVVDRDALARQARATLLRTKRNAEIDLTDKKTSRPIPEERAPRLRLFAR